LSVTCAATLVTYHSGWYLTIPATTAIDMDYPGW